MQDLPAMPQAQFASLLRIPRRIWPQMNPFLLFLLRPTSGDSDISVSPRLGTPITTSPGQGHVLTGHRGWHWSIPASGCAQPQCAPLCWASLPLAAAPLAGLSPTRAFLFSSQRISLLARDVLWRPGRARSRAKRGRAGGGDSGRAGGGDSGRRDGRSSAGASRRGH